MLSESIVSVQREFCRKFGDDRQRGAAPSRKIIGQWHETGSVQVKARTRRNTVRSPENIQRVRKALERSHVDKFKSWECRLTDELLNTKYALLHGPTFHCSPNPRPRGTQPPLSATPPTTHTSSIANSKWVMLNAAPCSFVFM